MDKHPESQPLSDLRVIDLTHGIAGPYCTKLLADFGADVIKVERTDSGDYARTLGPYPQDVPHQEKSGLFLFLNTNKRGITLDLKAFTGVEVLKKLVEGADILVENFRPGVMERLGLGYDTLNQVNPDLVMTSISNFGQTGPYRDYKASELVLYAMGNSMNRTGLADRYPLKLGGNHVQYQAGNNAAMATMFAWYARKYNGMGGQYLDISIFETQMGSINMRMMSLIGYQYNGMRSKRLGGAIGGYPMGVYPCKDGYISVAGGGQRFPRVAASLGRPELAEDPRFGISEGTQKPEYKEEFETTIWLPWLMQRTKEEIVQQCQANELLLTSYNTIDQVVDNNPQLDARGYFRELDHPVAGTFRYPGAPIFTDAGWWQIRRPAPLLGQHNQELLENEFGHSREEVQRLAKTGSRRVVSYDTSAPAADRSPSGEDGKAWLPLEGIRVIDMTVVLAGPYGTMFLGDMGAEVIRVETLNQLSATSRGQFARPNREAEAKAPTSAFPDKDPGARAWNRFAGFNAHGRNKYGITVDLRTPEGIDIFHRLVDVSDLFIENNAVGSMERLGLTYDILSQWNPRLIMISITGFGQTGPWNYHRGIGTSFEAAYGHASVMGYTDMGPEGVPLTVPADAATGVTVAMAATIALHEREKSGKGMFVDISLGENFLPHLGELFMDYSINRRVARSSGNRDHLGTMVQGVYPCAGDDEWIAISISRIEQWRAICRVMGKPELVENHRFDDMDKLRTHHDEVDQIIGSWTIYQDPIALFHRLQGEGVIAGPLLHEAHAYNDPHVRERGFFVPVTAPEVGTHLYPGTTFKMSKVPFLIRKPPVRLGEDNDYVYREVLMLSEEEYDRLKDLGHIGMDYAPHVK
jgi:crotonobetainyl-CoA:carnitine CoA-transferase CaiB-like acyl-CoA transferase